MSYMDSVMTELKADDSTAAVTDTTTTTDTVQEPVQEPEQVQETAQEQPKKDLSAVSKQEKAEYAFKRQLAKQRDRYNADLKSRDDAIDSLRKEVEALKAAKAPEQAKNRADFQTDDEYISYLAGRQVDSIMADRDAKAARAEQERQEQARADQDKQELVAQQQDLFRANVEQAIPADRLDQFKRDLKIAVDNGLGQVLDNAPMVRDYIFTSVDGPKVLERILGDRQAFMQVFGQRDPMLALLEARDIARSQPVQVQDTPKVVMPNLGKPGAGGNGGGGVNAVLDDDNALIKFMRGSRHR